MAVDHILPLDIRPHGRTATSPACPSELYKEAGLDWATGLLSSTHTWVAWNKSLHISRTPILELQDEELDSGSLGALLSYASVNQLSYIFSSSTQYTELVCQSSGTLPTLKVSLYLLASTGSCCLPATKSQ